MRTLSALAVAVVALTSVACGSAAPEAGNAYETQGLDGIDGLTRVAVDEADSGCSVDGVRFGRCTLTRTSATDVRGQSLAICDLEVDGGGTYSWQCDDSSQEFVSAVERYDARYAHCPNGG